MTQEMWQWFVIVMLMVTNFIQVRTTASQNRFNEKQLDFNNAQLQMNDTILRRLDRWPDRS